jgi:hypothetical protein
VAHEEDLLGYDLPDVVDVFTIPATTVEIVDTNLIGVGEAHLLEQLGIVCHVETQRLQALLAIHLRWLAVLDFCQYHIRWKEKWDDAPHSRSKNAPASQI